ncbi:MAG: phytanoyl-CoA dioxygenase family protein [Rhizobiales bacterium]|nr:phytanoyl-CoA dioxygenase family protein [Hyphomicrobiales bacterium]MBO6698915.1 phytanoyl-CoA dioxygenase family protein [Hyphomicrobiales bacterium]MBO6734832.1 phytanoyl-CoA dioxygenase family protein [Hyphomicrobiales bacterium]MBO6911362.1 phytanoyl-CoA dioxygenase family protein [Hyphomicrobiales bacterium]MBO6955505.1 phytanoyl-CoA dioxygenase family protein [Hyphomicrobiales bacterium]
MKHYTPDTVDTDEIVQELLNGEGVVLLSGLFTPEQIAEARAIIMQHSEQASEKVTHFQGAAEAEGTISLQRRVWNLLAKGEVFSQMATHPVLMQILRKFLGSEFIMGSIAANRLLPGGPGQEPHVDYPYWDFHAPETHPVGLNGSFPMNAQVSVILDPFTKQSGATAYVPGSQRELRYPQESDKFFERCAQMEGEPGDVALFYGVTWHCAMPNKADHDRNAVLIQYLPKFVKPMEDMPAALPQSFVDEASPDMRQLLGFNYPYPEVLDAAKAGNTEGRA